MDDAPNIIKTVLILLNLHLACGLYIHDAVTPRTHYVGIVGGEPARIEDFPYLVSLWKKGELHCGGSILNDRFILTAGHCVLLMDTTQYYVLAGTTNIAKGGQRYNVEQIIRHDDFNFKGNNDICLLKLATSIIFSAQVSVARLPEHAITFSEGMVFNVTGWGTREYDGEKSTTLQRTLVPWVDQNTCEMDYRGMTNVNEKMFCAGTNGHDACQGDSGGPLLLHGVVVGIVSRGKSCARKQYPTIYTKVSEYRDWIQENLTK